MPIRSPTIKVTKNDAGKSKLNITFHAIDDAVNQSDPSVPIFVNGHYIYEELQSYSPSLRIYNPHDMPIVNHHGDSFFQMFRHMYYGRSHLFNKISSFMESYGRRFVSIGEDEIGEICAESDDILEDEIASLYIASRRQKKHADSEIREYISLSRSFPHSGPAIISTQNIVGFHNILTIRMWDAGGRNYPLVIAAPNLNPKSPQGYQRKYVNFDHIINVVSKEFKRNKRDVVRHFDYWKATLGAHDQFNYQEPSGHHAVSFFDFISNISISGEELFPTIPQLQRPAPIMFSRQEACIGLDHTASIGTPISQVKGGARALIHQASDVMAIPALDNASPRASIKITRIISILERIGKLEQLEIADLIEFGVEFCAFETTMHEAQSRIGELSLGDIIAFLGEGRRFLSRFDSWNEYENDALKMKPGARESAHSAVDILASASASHMLTEDARIRVNLKLEQINSSAIDSNLAEGVSRSAENLTAVAGRAIADTAKNIAKTSSDEFAKSVSKSLSDSASKFIIENSPKLIALAHTRGAKWIEMLVHWFNSR